MKVWKYTVVKIWKYKIIQIWKYTDVHLEKYRCEKCKRKYKKSKYIYKKTIK